MMPQRILVIGGAGFIGSHTVELLLSGGKQVVVLDNLSSGRLDYLPMTHPDLEFIEGDVLEYPFVLDLLKDVDAVLHLAAISSVQQSIEKPIYSFQVNTQGFLHVLCAIQEIKRAIRLVYASSAAVYGAVHSLPCRDDVPLNNPPLSPYALQKVQNEMYAELYANLYSLPSLALRYFNVYGPRQDAHSPYSGVMSRFLAAYQADQPLTIFGDGLQSRDFIHVHDVARANCLALEKSHVIGALNVATGEPKSLLDLIEYINDFGQKKAEVSFQPGRLGDIRASYASTQKAKEQLEFKYQIPLQEGMKLMMQTP
ncbi:MAG: hypothetical protein A3F12_01485 [Gammaproteobacteria bacterium RIFCSPHIGHO2_12_FULL_38_14]|nr:MAG: hypothetical protein A3F12_01485 [Gammaproteobacteria bacterium RIFCSPHIGHO2_12_FULL_38_14]